MEIRTPMRAIRAKCIDCCGGSVYEPKHCTVKSCPLYAYRLGHRPQDKDLYSEDIKNAAPLT